MLTGTVEFYDHFRNIILEMDIEDFDSLSLEEKFKLILKKNAIEVVIVGYSNNHQSEPYKKIFFSSRY
jgi:hypothetical protein